MFQKIILLTTLLGIAVGLFTGILDSFFHYVGFENYRVVNIVIFVLFFASVYFATIAIRNKYMGGFMNYMGAVKNSFYIGAVASAIIALVRFVYLKYIAVIEIDKILNKTEQTMLNHYSGYNEELIDNRLSFIEFSYDPFVSSIMYLLYYLIISFAFSIIASFVIKKIDRNISI